MSTIEQRAAALTDRAIEKYGPTAGSPKGEESRDVFDYAINELAGIPRYVEMMINRVKDMPLALDERIEIILQLQDLATDCTEHALRLEATRYSLLSRQIDLGEPEAL